MANKITGALEEIVVAWRDHIAWPASIADIRELMRNGPSPVDTDGRADRPRTSQRMRQQTQARARAAAQAAEARGSDEAAAPFGVDLNTLIPTMTANRDLGHSGRSDLDDVDDIPGLSAQAIASLRAAGFVSVGDIRGAGVAKLSRVPGVGPQLLEILARA